MACIPLAEGMEGNYREVRGRRAQHLRRLQKNCPDRALAVHLMREYVRSCRFAGCTTDARYLEALGLKVPAAEK